MGLKWRKLAGPEGATWWCLVLGQLGEGGASWRLNSFREVLTIVKGGGLEKHSTGMVEQ
jgi:hypothetical protein